jgi:hypothetical protein
MLGVAGGVHLAVDGGDRDAEQAGIGLAELGDIVGDFAAGSRPKFAQVTPQDSLRPG